MFPPNHWPAPLYVSVPIMKYILYSTSKSYWYQEQANIAAQYLRKTKGREDLDIVVEYVKPPRYPQVIKDKAGNVRLNWDWFDQTFDKGEYDGIGFHFTPYYKRKWGLTKSGNKNPKNKDTPQFYFACEKEMAEGYDFSNFVRLLIHEISHFDEDLDDNNGNRLQQESVHIVDYKLKQIHLYPQLVDYRGYLLKRKVNALVNKVIDFVRNAIKL